MDIKKMIDSYTDWLNKSISFEKIGEYYEITTPYLDRFNDYLQIYVKQVDEVDVFFTDDGYIIGNLIACGMQFKKNSTKQRILERTIHNYGLTLDGEAITAVSKIKDFPKKKHMMVQAMLLIDNMFELRKSNVKSLFLEDVTTFFDKHEIYYTRDFSIIGKTKNIYTYDFHFQRNKANPTDRFCRVINHLNKSIRDATIFNWLDTMDAREDSSTLITIINDENKINEKDIVAFESYAIKPILFSSIGENQNVFV